MTNLRDAWQQDMAQQASESQFTATVTAVPGGGTVTFKRYPDAAAETQPKLASYTSPQVGDVVVVEALGSGWIVTGLVSPIYQPVAVVTALPTASATYRGVALRVQGGTGVADGVWICEKGTSGTYSWVQLDYTQASSPYGMLGTATNGSGQSGISIDTAITGMSISATAPSSGYLRASFVLTVTPTVTGGVVGSTFGGFRVTLRKDGTEVAHFDQFGLHTYAATYAFSWVWTPTGGSHTWTLTINDNVTSSTTIAVAAGGNFAIEAVAP